MSKATNKLIQLVKNTGDKRQYINKLLTNRIKKEGKHGIRK